MMRERKRISIEKARIEDDKLVKEKMRQRKRISIEKARTEDDVVKEKMRQRKRISIEKATLDDMELVKEKERKKKRLQRVSRKKLSQNYLQSIQHQEKYIVKIEHKKNLHNFKD